MIVPYYKPEITAIVSLAEELALDLCGYGACVTVITGFPHRGIGHEITKEYVKRADEWVMHNLRIQRVGSRRGEGKNLFLRTIWHLGRTYSFYKTAKHVLADVFLIYSTPPLMGLLGTILARRVPVFYCLQDIFPDNLICQGRLKESSIIFRLLKAAENYIYSKVTFISTISEDMKQNLLMKNVDEKKVVVIENWADAEKIKRVDRMANHLFDRFGLDRDSFYVTYCGNLGYAQDPDSVLECAKKTASEVPAIKYIIVGNGIQQPRIAKRIKEEGIKNVIMFPLQPQEDSALVYSLGDVGLVLLKRNMLCCSMPSKVWTMMAASLPLICTAEKQSGLYDIIRSAEAGILVDPEDGNGLKEAVISMYREKADLYKYGEKGRVFVQNNLQRGKATQAYFNLLSNKENRDV